MKTRGPTRKEFSPLDEFFFAAIDFPSGAFVARQFYSHAGDFLSAVKAVGFSRVKFSNRSESMRSDNSCRTEEVTYAERQP